MRNKPKQSKTSNYTVRFCPSFSHFLSEIYKTMHHFKCTPVSAGSNFLKNASNIPMKRRKISRVEDWD